MVKKKYARDANPTQNWFQEICSENNSVLTELRTGGRGPALMAMGGDAVATTAWEQANGKRDTKIGPQRQATKFGTKRPNSRHRDEVARANEILFAGISAAVPQMRMKTGLAGWAFRDSNSHVRWDRNPREYGPGFAAMWANRRSRDRSSRGDFERSGANRCGD